MGHDHTEFMNNIAPNACFVAGCGSIGRRHIRNLRTLGTRDIYAFDTNPERLAVQVRDFGVVPCDSFEEGLARNPSLVLVCTPPSEHIPLALLAVRAGCHVFIEKPLSHSLDEVETLLTAAAMKGRFVYVGYNWRFHPGLRQIHQRLENGAIGRLLTVRSEFGQYLPDWRPSQDYRASYTARASMGGGIIRDASHEIDYVRWLAGEVRSVYCVAGKISSLEMDVEDTAEIALRMETGSIAQIHVDCTQRSYTRTCKIIGETGTFMWDYAFGIGHYDARSGRWRVEPIVYDANSMYVNELAHVLMCVRGEAHLEVDGEAGKRVLAITMAALESAKTHAEVIVAPVGTLPVYAGACDRIESLV